MHIKTQGQGDVHLSRLPVKVSPTVSHGPGTQWPTVDLRHIPHVKRRLDIKPAQPRSVHNPEKQWPAINLGHTTSIKRSQDIKAPSPASDSSSSSDSEDETTMHIKTQGHGDVHLSRLPVKVSPTVGHGPGTQWPTVDLQHIPHVKRRLDIKPVQPRSVHNPEKQWPNMDLGHATSIKKSQDIKAPSSASDSSSSSDSEDETTMHVKPHGQGDVHLSRLPVKVSPTVSHGPGTQWPTVDLRHIPHIKRRLDIKPARPRSVHNPEKQWPAINLGHTTSIKRSQEIKAPSPASDSSSSSDSEDETTMHVKTHVQGDVHLSRAPVQVSPTVSHGLGTQWPTVDLRHIPHVKRRLDIKPARPHSVRNPETQWPTIDLQHTTSIKRSQEIKAQSSASDSSSSSDSEDDTTMHVKTQGQGDVHLSKTPVQVSPTVSHGPGTQWPTVDLQHIPRIKRRLDIKPAPPRSVRNPETQWPTMNLQHTTSIKRSQDIKAPSPASDSSSSSDSEEETTMDIKTQGQGDVHLSRLPVKVSPTLSHGPGTQWPTVDLQHIPHIKRRLDIKPARPRSVHNPEKQWPAINLGHTTSIKRSQDIKAPSSASDSSFSSDSEDETTMHVKTQGHGDVHISRPDTKSHSPDAQWPTMDLKHTTSIKRSQEIKAPSSASDSSSSSDSEDETTMYIKTQGQGNVHLSRLPVHVSPTVSHDLGTQWPTVDLQHIPHIKRRLDIKPAPTRSVHNPETQWPAMNLGHTTSIKRSQDIKAPSPASDSSSSSDSEDGTIRYVKTQEHIPRLPVKVSPSTSNKAETQWPNMDLHHTTSIKRSQEIKVPSPASDSSSSSDSEDETTMHIKTQGQGNVHLSRLPVQVSPTVGHDLGTQWPTVDLQHIPHIKRRLDIKPAPTRSVHNPEIQWPAMNLGHTTSIKRSQDIKAPSPASDSSSSSDSEDETTMHVKTQGQGGVHISRPDTKSHSPGTQWPTMELKHTTSIKRSQEIKAPSSASDSSSSSDNEDETIRYVKTQEHIPRLPVKVSPTTSHKAETQWPNMDLQYTTSIKRSQDIKAPSSASGSSSSSDSDSEDKNEDHKSKIENKFVQPQNVPINIPHSPKTEQNIKLEKYTVLSDDLENKPRTNNIHDTSEINSELQNRWATMNLGISRFRKRLEISSPTHETSLSPPNSPISESPAGRKSSTRLKRRGDGISEKAHASLSDSSSSSSSEDEIDHRVPDLSLGVPRLKRRLDIKAPSPEPSNSPSSSSESDDNATGYTTTKSTHASHMSRITDYDSPITYKRLIIKTSSAPESYVYPSSKIVAQEHEGEQNASVSSKRVRSMGLHNIIKRKIGRDTVDLPPEIKWTGHHLPDLSISTPRSLNASSSVDNSPGSAYTIPQLLSEERRERKGLSAIKAISTERQNWDTEDLHASASPLFNHRDLQDDTHYRRSEANITPLSKLPSAAPVEEATDFMYGIPSYRRHAVRNIELLKEAPPPVPSTPPPDETEELTWRSL
ncbi:mucin-4-like [Mugil cephalus]|uniref:mucin-4-like n=1 Tax=Mugil cephalus TaxID=48193 RepID=UPI001FB7AEFD|nr:mucin-4-like [Mugil cephalus]